MSGLFDPHSSEPLDAACSAAQIEALQQLVGSGRVCDFGCGNGRVAIPLARGGAHVVAFDRLAERLAPVLGDRGYREQARFFHSHGATHMPMRPAAGSIYFCCCFCLARMPCRADGTCGGVRVANGARANADVMQHDDRQSGYVVVLVEDGHAARLKAAKRKREVAEEDGSEEG